VFFLAVVGAALYGVLWMGLRRGEGGTQARIPLGSFLCAATIYAVFEGQATVGWYLGFFR
jgi:hypothetical protein